MGQCVMQHVFIIGSRGLPAKYGGFETFVEELVKHQTNPKIQYHVACLSDDRNHEHFDYCGADCFTINPPKLGPARVIAYDMMAISYGLEMVKKEGIKSPIFYVLGNTIGAFVKPFVTKIKALDGKLFINPDGLEWKRSKWSKPVQSYLKFSEKMMARHADLVISDNKGIEDYIKSTYPSAKTTFIAYGTDTIPSTLSVASNRVRDYFTKFQLSENNYYLILGRFVPENNYETAIREFMKAKTDKDLVIITNHDGNSFFEELKERTHFENDHRVKFVGTVYDRELLNYIRENAFAYIHGHEVGGTNPGLLEALAHTRLNLVLGVSFNQSVAQDSVLYWTKEKNNLSRMIDECEKTTNHELYSQKAKAIIQSNYTWQKIVGEYEDLFLNEN